MWRLKKPDLDTAIGDIDNVIAHSNGRLDESDAPTLGQLYRDYDAGHGFVSDQMHDSAMTAKKADIVYDQYAKTRFSYSSEGLKYMRRELMADAAHCPYCGFGEPSHLDHVMPEGRYKALSVCRLNLVPSCSVCNVNKGKNNRFVHPYYQAFPAGVRFLVATICVVSNVLVASFSIDDSVIDQQLAELLRKQILVIDLDDRLRREVNRFIREIPTAALTSDDTLHKYLELILADMKADFGLNHWKTAVIDALYRFPGLTVNHIRNHRAATLDADQIV